RLTEQRRRREVLELAPPPLVRVDLGGAAIADQLQRRLPEQVRILTPQEGDGGRGRHRSDATTGPRPVKAIVIVPCWSVRQPARPPDRLGGRLDGPVRRRRHVRSPPGSFSVGRRLLRALRR